MALCEQAVATHLAYRKIDARGMDGEIHYYRPAKKGDTLQAVAYVRKAGRKISVFFVELKNQEGKLLADALLSAVHME